MAINKVDLLNQLKNSIGYIGNDNDVFYKQNIDFAIADLKTDDVSDNVIESQIGTMCIVIYAMALINEPEKIATSQTLIMLRNKLSSMTKGERYNVG